jgi:hypothetical protein
MPAVHSYLALRGTTFWTDHPLTAGITYYQDVIPLRCGGLMAVTNHGAVIPYQHTYVLPSEVKADLKTCTLLQARARTLP